MEVCDIPVHRISQKNMDPCIAVSNWESIGIILGLYWGYIGVILGLYWGYIGVI